MLRHLTLLLGLLPALPARAADAPTIALTAPADGAITPLALDAPGFPNVGVGVQFQVSGWVYPAVGKGVHFGLDAWRPGQEPLVISEAANVAFVSPIPAGRHTLWGCLATLYAGLWSPLDLDLDLPDVQPACASLTLDVAIVDCHPYVTDGVSGAPACDPIHPEACCLDANPCSVETCESVARGDTSHLECRFEPAEGPCCQSDLECSGAGQACDATTHQCTGGEPPPDTFEPAPEQPEVVAEIVEPAPEPVAEAQPEPPAEVVEPLPEVVPEPGAEAESPGPEGAPDSATDAPHADLPEVTEASADVPSGLPDAEPDANGGGGCSASSARAPTALLVVLLALGLVVTARRRARS